MVVMPLIVALMIIPEGNRKYITEAFSAASNLSVIVEYPTPCKGENQGILPQYLLPLNISQAQHVQEYQRIQQYFRTTGPGNFILPYPNGEIFYALNLQNNDENKEWIRISNIIIVSVTTLNDGSLPLKDLNVYHEFYGCGGDFYRHFPSTFLNGNTYKSILMDTEADSFSLQPGEYEDFLLKLNCTSPGAYAVKYLISFTTGGNNGQKEINEKFVCPISFTIWRDYAESFNVYKYTWKNNKYILDISLQREGLYTINSNGAPFILRNAPSINAQVVTTLLEGRMIRIDDGPVLSDGLTWWHGFVFDSPDDIAGWIEDNPSWFTLDDSFLSP